MFFDGTIQEGISTAVGQQKLVLCFVTDENEESQQWENEFLQDESLKDVIDSQAIALRLKAGSDEAGYLSQIFPLPKTPTIVIMKHGELKEYIAAGTSKEDFVRRISNAFSPSSSALGNAAAAAASASPAASSTPGAAESSPQAEATQMGTSPGADRSENVARVLAERAARAEKEAAEKKAKEAAAAEARQEAKGKARAEPDAAQFATSSGAKEQADIIKKKKQAASDERSRILQRIENDKEARRLQAAERERKRQDAHAAEQAEATSATTPKKTADYSKAAIQVRLLDGSSIRSRFQASAPFTDIRKWVDQERTDEKLPYSFKQVLAPLPNKPIETGEEAQSISELGLAPSANLLLIPAATKFAVAYDGDASGNLLSRIIGMILGVFSWILSLVGLGGQQVASVPPQTESSTATSTSTSSAAAKAAAARRTRGPGDWKKDQQLYNGNSLNFEPRPDEDEK